MHEFKIIHFDIKPENLIYSDHFQKPVFIDFGLSEIINEEFGFKTLSAFRGTPNYCTPEMLQIMMEREDYADLYYNDVHGLKLVINEIHSKK
jgi:serine/threonine protein kinase